MTNEVVMLCEHTHDLIGLVMFNLESEKNIISGCVYPVDLEVARRD